jgi:hypothetical protein
MAGAGVTVAVLVAVAGGLVGTRPADPRAPVAAPFASSPATTRGGNAASCAFGPDERTLPQRAVAFDGTVLAIGPGRTNRPGAARWGYVSITFHVNRWFKGGRGPTATVDVLRSFRGGPMTEDGPPPFDIGTRMLVSGDHRWGGRSFDDVFAQGCGFTGYYGSREAALWQRAFD